MQIKLKDFKEAASKILVATGLDEHTANLEISTRDTNLYLTVTNKEFFVSVKFPLESEDNEFRAVVDASLFLSLVSEITTETFSLSIQDTNVVISSGKSNYKVPMIYENNQLMELPVITIQNKTVEMDISNDILQSILNVNSKELAKVKNVDVNELQKLYYIDETGCFTFTTGACVNAFTLEKPVKLLLNERIVKLFKLFKDEPAHFTLGQDLAANGLAKTKMVLQTSDVYLAAIITCDDILINKVQGPCMATKRFINEVYSHRVVVSATDLAAAISRLLTFTKLSKADEKVNPMAIKMWVTVDPDELTIKDKFGNTEVINTENGSYSEDSYSMPLNIIDLKLVVDSCKNEHITINCGNMRSIVVTRGAISNLIPECKRN